MRTTSTVLFVIASMVALHAAAARGQSDQEVASDVGLVEEESEYAEAGSTELGGSFGLSWETEAFNITATPSIGYFLFDNVELSALLNLGYQNIEEDDDRVGSTSVGFVVEPSYHYEFVEDVFAFGGLGVGAGYHASEYDLELVPRVGVNIAITDSAIITPAVRVPVYFNAEDVDAGVFFEAGFSTTL